MAGLARSTVLRTIAPMHIFLRRLIFAGLLPLSLGAAVETWTLNGKSVQAECLGAKGDYVVFKKADGTRLLIPHDKLSPSDQARVAGNEFKGTNNTVTIAPTPAPDPSELSKIAAGLQGKLVSVNGRAVRDATPERLAGTQMYAIYYSASWCGPCRRFTPNLVAAYPKIKAAHPEFEVIFVSSDEDEIDMKNYMLDDRMPWLGLRFSERPKTPMLVRYQQSGIPNLVFIDGNGRVLSKSYDDRGAYLGPQKVLSDILRYFKM